MSKAAKANVILLLGGAQCFGAILLNTVKKKQQNGCAGGTSVLLFHAPFGLIFGQLNGAFVAKSGDFSVRWSQR